MKYGLIMVAFYLMQTDVFCQELNLKDLQKLSSFKTIDSIDTYLHSKEYDFWTTVKVEGNDIDTLEYAFKYSKKSGFEIYVDMHNYGFYEINYDIDTNEKLFYQLKNDCSKLKNIRLMEERTVNYDDQQNTALFRSYYDGKFQYDFAVNSYKDGSPNRYNMSVFIIKTQDLLRLEHH